MAHDARFGGELNAPDGMGRPQPPDNMLPEYPTPVAFVTGEVQTQVSEWFSDDPVSKVVGMWVGTQITNALSVPGPYGDDDDE
jgi:hypothetical protein